MAAPGVSVVVLGACIVVLLVFGGGSGGAAAQGVGQCVPQLNRLLACRAYLVPGAPDQSHDCACSTMGIFSSLPGRCNLAPVNCSAA